MAVCSASYFCGEHPQPFSDSKIAAFPELYLRVVQE